MNRSMLPDGTLHELPLAENPVILRKVQYGGTKHRKVEDLVARPAEIKLAGRAPLRAPNHVYYRPLYVDIPTEGVYPGRVP